jgi:hypothetical protein
MAGEYFFKKNWIDLMAININDDQIDGQIFLIIVRISTIYLFF